MYMSRRKRNKKKISDHEAISGCGAAVDRETTMMLTCVLWNQYFDLEDIELIPASMLNGGEDE